MRRGRCRQAGKIQDALRYRNLRYIINAEIASDELTPIEHNAVAWVTQAETAGYEFCPADAKMLRENELRKLK